MQDHLISQFNSIQAVGQVSTSTGEEVICTSGSKTARVESSRMASAFVETDQLAKSLKLGAIRQVIISQSSDRPSKAPPRTNSVVQSKSYSKTYDHPDTDSLLTTTIAPSLHNALIGDEVIRDAAQRVLGR